MATKYTLPEGQKLATFKVDESNWETFKTLCEDAGISASKALNNFIQMSLDAGELGAAAITPVKDIPTNIGVDIDALEARLMAKVRAEFANIQQPTDIEARLEAVEEALTGKF